MRSCPFPSGGGDPTGHTNRARRRKSVVFVLKKDVFCFGGGGLYIFLVWSSVLLLLNHSLLVLGSSDRDQGEEVGFTNYSDRWANAAAEEVPVDAKRSTGNQFMQVLSARRRVRSTDDVGVGEESSSSSSSSSGVSGKISRNTRRKLATVAQLTRRNSSSSSSGSSAMTSSDNNSSGGGKLTSR